MALKSTKSTAKPTGKDAIQAGTSESDTIANLNKGKIARIGNGNDNVVQADAATPETTAATATATIAGSDSTNGQTQPEPPQLLTLKPDELQAMMDARITQAVAPLQTQLDQTGTQLATATQDLQATQQQLKTANDEVSRLTGVFQVMGSQVPSGDKGGAIVPAQQAQRSDQKTTGFPMINTLGSDKPVGAAREFVDALSDARITPSKKVYVADRGVFETQRDMSQLTQFYRQNKDALQRDMEAYAKGHGLLQGWKAADAATTRSDVPPAYLDLLSLMLRETQRPGLIYHQFIDVKLDIGKGPGETSQIPRIAYLPQSENLDDYELSGSGTFALIDTNNLQAIQIGSVPATIKEYGMGKQGTTNQLVAIPEFVTAYSQIDLMNALETRLGHHYFIFEDRKIRSLWKKTSRVVYNNNDRVVTAASGVTSGGDGRFTEMFANALYAYARGLQFPTLRNGCYGFAGNTYAIETFKNSLGTKLRATSEAEIQEVTNILNSARQGGEMDRVSGYVGTYCNLMLFETNAHSLGAAGTEGAQTETLGAGAAITRSSYLFGASSIGRGIGMPMEVRRDSNDNMQRVGRYGWYSHEAFTALDVDPAGYNDTSAVPQQLRVLEVRNTHEEV